MPVSKTMPLFAKIVKVDKVTVHSTAFRTTFKDRVVFPHVEVYVGDKQGRGGGGMGEVGILNVPGNPSRGQRNALMPRRDTRNPSQSAKTVTKYC